MTALVPPATVLQTAAVANGNGAALSVAGYASVEFNVTANVAMAGGTTVNFEYSPDNGTPWVALLCVQEGTTTTATSTTTASVWRAGVVGVAGALVRARISAYSAGTITVTCAPSVLSAGTGVGGGGGVSGGVPQSTSDILTSVPASASSVVLLAANAARVGVKVVNDSSANLYIAYAATASVSSYTAKLVPGDAWVMDVPIYAGILSGIWDSATGNARITESSGQMVAATVSLTGSVTIAASGVSAGALVDGADVAQGLTTDTAVTTDANGTLSAKLRGLVKILADAWDSTNHRLNTAIAAALPAGTNIIGKVGIDQTTPGTTNAVVAGGTTVAATGTFTRPANTTAYTANTVVSAATSSASSSYLTIANVARASGPGTGLILAATLLDGMNAGTAGNFILYLFTANPSATMPNDDAAMAVNSADLAKAAGYISFASTQLLNAGAGTAGARLYLATSVNLPFKIASGTTLYGILVATNAYTPGSGGVFTATLLVAQD